MFASTPTPVAIGHAIPRKFEPASPPPDRKLLPSTPFVKKKNKRERDEENAGCEVSRGKSPSILQRETATNPLPAPPPATTWRQQKAAPEQRKRWCCRGRRLTARPARSLRSRGLPPPSSRPPPPPGGAEPRGRRRAPAARLSLPLPPKGRAGA